MRARSHRVGEEQLPLEPGLPGRRMAAVVPQAAEKFHRAGDQRRLGGRIERVELDREAIRRRDVVCVVARDDAAARMRQGAVRARIRPQVAVVAEDADPGVPALVLRQNPWSAVGRAIVHDQELEVGDRLG